MESIPFRAEEEPAVVLLLEQRDERPDVADRRQVVVDIGHVPQAVDAVANGPVGETAAAMRQDPPHVGEAARRVLFEVVQVQAVSASVGSCQVHRDPQLEVVGHLKLAFGEKVADTASLNIARDRKDAVRFEPDEAPLLYVALDLGRRVGRGGQPVHSRQRVGADLLGHHPVVCVHVGAEGGAAQHQVMHLAPRIDLLGPRLQCGEVGVLVLVLLAMLVRDQVAGKGVDVRIVDTVGDKICQLFLPDLSVLRAVVDGLWSIASEAPLQIPVRILYGEGTG